MLTLSFSVVFCFFIRSLGKQKSLWPCQDRGKELQRGCLNVPSAEPTGTRSAASCWCLTARRWQPTISAWWGELVVLNLFSLWYLKPKSCVFATWNVCRTVDSLAPKLWLLFLLFHFLIRESNWKNPLLTMQKRDTLWKNRYNTFV